MRRDLDSNSIDPTIEVLRAVGKLAKAKGVRSPPTNLIINKAVAHLKNAGQASLEATAEEVLADCLEAIKSQRDNDTKADNGYTSTGSVTSLVLAVAFKSVVERFRKEVWGLEESQGETKPPFQEQDAACVWLELLHRLEEKMGDYSNPSEVQMFSLFMSDSGPVRWRIPTEGVMQKLFEFCKALAEAAGWWDTNNALKFVLLGWLPAPIRVQPEGGFGNQSRGFTITINGPITEETLVEFYRQACETAHVMPQKLSHTHYRLLFLVHYLMPDASWPQRFGQWLEWCQTDETLPSYGAKLRKDRTVENPEGYKNLKGEYRRAMDRQSWEDKVPKLLHKENFDGYWSRRRSQMTVKASPLPPWETPDFDTSGFEHPHVDLGKLEKLCLEAEKLNPYPHNITTFWQWYEDKD